MSSNLEIRKEQSGDEVTFFLVGQIDEDADLGSIDFSGAKKVIFHLEDINMINSCGIRDWVEFQGKIPNDVRIIYRKCPQVIIEQINIIKGFIKEGGVIESFYAPYYNEEKDEELKILLTPAEVIDFKAPVKIDSEGNELEFDEIELQYFNFLKNN